VDTSFPARRVIQTLEGIALERGHSERIVCDNGPEFRSQAMDEWAYEYGFSLAFIQPGKPVPFHNGVQVMTTLEVTPRGVTMPRSVPTTTWLHYAIALAAVASLSLYPASAAGLNISISLQAEYAEPTAAPPGAPVAIPDCNLLATGNASTESWNFNVRIRIYLSSDGAITAGTPVLLTDSYSQAHNAGNPLWGPALRKYTVLLPDDTPLGNYLIAIRVDDAFQVAETSENDNITYARIIVSEPSSVAIAATTSGRLSSIAFPVYFADETVQNNIVGLLGERDDTRWRFGHWDADFQKYVHAEYGELNAIARGRGYWLITREPATVRVTGILPSQAAPVTLPLAGGAAAWNQLGNPYLADVPVSMISVKSEASGLVWLVKDPDNPIVEPSVWIWDAALSRYDDQAVAVPAFAAFWIKKKDSTPGSVDLPGLPGTLATAAPATLASNTKAPSQVGAATWGSPAGITLTARQATMVSNRLTLGIAPVEAGEWNPLNVSLPPEPPGRTLRLAIPKTSWGRRNGEYASEYQPAADEVTWEFSLAGGDMPGDLELDFEAFGLEPEQRILLSEPATGQAWDVEPGRAISVASTGSPRRLRISLNHDSSSLPVSAQTSFRVYPNPSRGSAGLLFRTSHVGDVRASVFDVQGRLLRDLDRRGAPQGEVVLVWDGKDRAGRDAGAGLYFARCQFGAESATLRVVLLR
jgi:hypothetical protein